MFSEATLHEVSLRPSTISKSSNASYRALKDAYFQLHAPQIL